MQPSTSYPGDLWGASIIERGLFDPAHVNQIAVYMGWTAAVATMYGIVARKYRTGPREFALVLLALVMPPYALRYVFFGTRWGSNSSFAMVDSLFTSFCPAKILLPCPADDPTNCQLSFPKLLAQSTGRPSMHSPAQFYTLPTSTDKPWLAAMDQTRLPELPNSTAPAVGPEQAQLSRQHLHFPVLVPLWRIYVQERPLPIYLHTSFMTVAALLWPLQLWDAFRQQHLKLHRKLGYLAVAATLLGSLSGAPYAISYLLSSDLPEQVTGFGYLCMYTSAACFLTNGVQAARKKRILQHQRNMVRMVGLGWGVSPLGRLLTITPPIIWFTGPWNNAAVVCLSWPLGIYLSQRFLLRP